MKTRQVAVVVPVHLPAPNVASHPSLPAANELQLLLVGSRKHRGRFVFPKGGVEENESSAEGGRREAWEEGGIRGEVIATLATDIPSSKGHKKDADLPKAAYSIHLLRVDSLDDDWPERKERERRWVSLEDAKDLVAWREEMRDGGLAAFPDEARIRELIAQSRP